MDYSNLFVILLGIIFLYLVIQSFTNSGMIENMTTLATTPTISSPGSSVPIGTAYAIGIGSNTSGTTGNLTNSATWTSTPVVGNEMIIANVSKCSNTNNPLACINSAPKGISTWYSCPSGNSPSGYDPNNPGSNCQESPGNINTASNPCVAGQTCYAVTNGTTSGPTYALKVINGITQCITDNMAKGLGIVPPTGKLARDQVAIAACQAANYRNAPSLISTTPCNGSQGDTSIGYTWKCN